MKKVICTATAGILALSLCAGCTTDSAEDGLTPVRLNEVVHSVFYAPQYVALEKGFFAEEGLEVSVAVGNGADIILRQGAAQFCFCIYIQVIGRLV